MGERNSEFQRVPSISRMDTAFSSASTRHSADTSSISSMRPSPRFESDFDSGNGVLLSSSQKSPRHYEYVLRTRCDAEGTPFEQKNLRSWFHFRITGARRGIEASFVIRGTACFGKLYQQGHKPVFRVGDRGEWNRIPGSFRSSRELGSRQRKRAFVLRFHHRFLHSAPTYFAFTFPFSYGELQEKIQDLESQFSNHDEIFFSRETLVHSLDGRSLDLLTISSHSHRLAPSTTPPLPPQPATVSLQQSLPLLPVSDLIPPPDALLPPPPLSGSELEEEGESEEEVVVLHSELASFPLAKLPFDWTKKSTYLLTSRIHAGETPSSHISNGFLDFILDETNPLASLLRDRFVFRVIPMLNPDGVARGHWRFHSLGHELNGCFAVPSISHHPTVFATRKLTDYLWCFENLKFYVDLHSHVNKRNAFIFGNALRDEEDQLQCILYPKLVSLRSNGIVDFSKCNFARTRMRSFTGTSRVVSYMKNGMIHAYTLEINPHSGDSPAVEEYDLNHFHAVGRGLASALVDFEELLPESSSVTSSQHRNLEGIRCWLRSQMRSNPRLFRGVDEQIIKYGREMLRTRLVDYVRSEGGFLGDSLPCPNLYRDAEAGSLDLRDLISRLITQFHCNAKKCQQRLKELDEERA